MLVFILAAGAFLIGAGLGVRELVIGGDLAIAAIWVALGTVACNLIALLDLFSSPEK